MISAYLGAPPSLGLKVVSVLPGNHGTERDSHQGAVLLFDTTTGGLLAVIDASSITAIRTAAVSGLATRLLAREDAGDLAILGSGVQASAHLEAMRTVRSSVACGSLAHAGSCAGLRAASRKKLGFPIEASIGKARDPRADLVCTTTSSREPFSSGVSAPGAYQAVVAAFGLSRVDTGAVVRSRLYVDRRESALHESGDFLIPKQEGAIGDDHIIGEIGELLLGRVPGRVSPGEITLFKSLGIAIEDLAAAHHIHARARAAGKGIAVDFGGRRLDYS